METVPIDADFGLMLNCSVRYALGRMTYVPSTLIRYIEPLLPFLDNRTITCFVRDLELHMEEVDNGIRTWGMDCDRQDWMYFYKLCFDEKRRRNIN